VGGWILWIDGNKASFKLGLGTTINNQAELVAASTLIQMEKERGISEIEIFQYSNIVIG
jgi:ribonuclease HI